MKSLNVYALLLEFSSCFVSCKTALIIVALLCSLKEFEEGKQEVMAQEIANLRDKVRDDRVVKSLSDMHSTMVAFSLYRSFVDAVML